MQKKGSCLRVGESLCLDVVLCGERGLGDFVDPSSVLGSIRFLGPIPNFSLRAGERIEVKELNIVFIFHSYSEYFISQEGRSISEKF